MVCEISEWIIHSQITCLRVATKVRLTYSKRSEAFDYKLWITTPFPFECEHVIFLLLLLKPHYWALIFVGLFVHIWKPPRLFLSALTKFFTFMLFRTLSTWKLYLENLKHKRIDDRYMREAIERNSDSLHTFRDIDE